MLPLRRSVERRRCSLRSSSASTRRAIDERSTSDDTTSSFRCSSSCSGESGWSPWKKQSAEPLGTDTETSEPLAGDDSDGTKKVVSPPS